MIRINLLPEPRTKGAKKQWDVRIEVAGAAVVIVLVVIVCFYYASMLDYKIINFAFLISNYQSISLILKLVFQQISMITRKVKKSG